jgi:hypothetical protein
MLILTQFPVETTQIDAEGEWTRSENFQTDMIRFFEQGDFSDVTFQVFVKETGEKKVG